VRPWRAGRGMTRRKPSQRELRAKAYCIADEILTFADKHKAPGITRQQAIDRAIAHLAGSK